MTVLINKRRNSPNRILQFAFYFTLHTNNVTHSSDATQHKQQLSTVPQPTSLLDATDGTARPWRSPRGRRSGVAFSFAFDFKFDFVSREKSGGIAFYSSSPPSSGVFRLGVREYCPRPPAASTARALRVTRVRGRYGKGNAVRCRCLAA